MLTEQEEIQLTRMVIRNARENRLPLIAEVIEATVSHVIETSSEEEIRFHIGYWEKYQRG